MPKPLVSVHERLDHCQIHSQHHPPCEKVPSYSVVFCEPDIINYLKNSFNSNISFYDYSGIYFNLNYARKEN